MSDKTNHTPVLTEAQLSGQAIRNAGTQILLKCRTFISLALIFAGIVLIIVGFQMMLAALQYPENHAFNLIVYFAVLALVASVVTFIVAYKALPDRRREPDSSRRERS